VAHSDTVTAQRLMPLLGLHPRAVHDCAVRNPVPKVHVYPGQVFVVLHRPERGARGHVHYVELDQYLGPNWLITVHGPMNPVVPLDAAYVETGGIARRVESGRLRPSQPCELSAALVEALIVRLREFLIELTQEVWELERQVTAGHMGDPEDFWSRCSGSGTGCWQCTPWPR